jgi:ATP-binding cassette subfamily B protein
VSTVAGPTRYRELLGDVVRPHWRRLVLLAFLLLAAIGLQLLGPLILRRFIDMAVSQSALSDTTTTALIYIGVALLTQIVAIADAYVAADVAWRATNRLRATVARHCLSHDMAFHDEHLPGELIERIDGDTSMLANFLSRFVVSVLGNALMLLGILIVLVSVDARVGLAVTAYTVCALFVLSRMRGIARRFWDAARQASADLFGFIEEHLSGTEDLRANGATGYVLGRLRRLLHARVRKERTAAWIP